MNVDNILNQLETMSQTLTINQINRIKNVLTTQSGKAPASPTQPSPAAQTPADIRAQKQAAATTAARSTMVPKPITPEPETSATPAADTEIKSTISNPTLAAKQAAAVDAVRSSMTTKPAVSTQPQATPTAPASAGSKYFNTTGPTVSGAEVGAKLRGTPTQTKGPTPQKFGQRGIPGLGENKFYSKFLNMKI